ncbi:ligand-binding sensor domain-containing protein [Clostridium uliginosum]|uniref:histidine kinase n=1 Tax=Clostridium uliginosum TaxID=119641 RepID=A0A1I1K3V5_9CLOT|nr:sensor histidine kinase [Clostridium uliginosum]SFC55647.1 Signal transduction histidine kinase [Clostridium uliginosum]
MIKKAIVKGILFLIVVVNVILLNPKINVKAYNNIKFNSISIDDQLSQSMVQTIFQDSRGYIWIGTYDGLKKYNGNDVKVYKYEENSTKSIANNTITSIREDKKGNLWVGTADGLSKINIYDDTVKNYYDHADKGDLSNYNICNILITNEGQVLVGTADGLNIYNEENDKFERILYKEDKKILPNQSIYSLDQDEFGHIWMGTGGGLNKVDIKNKKIEYSYDESNGFKNSIYKVYCDHNGYVWAGTFGEGLLKIKIKTNEIEKYKPNPGSNSSELQGGIIRDILKDSRGDIWICTNNGLSKYNQEEDNFSTYINKKCNKHSLIDKNAICIMEDKSKLMWVGTYTGISTFDPDNTDHNYKNNPVIKNALRDNFIQGIYEDDNGLFCIGTDTEESNIFNEIKTSKSKSSTKIIFDGFEVKGKKYNNIDGLEFNWDENMMKFKIFIPYYGNNNIKYYYKLTDVDDTWNVSKDNELVYNNIKSGKHTLKVKVKNEDGSISGENEVSFVIKPPIWRTKEAMLVYSAIIILIIYLNYNKMKRLDKMVEKRTKQLREEMEKSNKLLNKVIDLERRKNNYFVNLSHELRTPLNVISSTEQLISELNKQQEGIDKTKLNYYMKIIKRNSSRLLRLINNIIDTNKIESGRYETDIRENDIVYLVEETALSLKDYIENKGVHLIIDPEVEEKIIECDRCEIERCIVNLVSNAAKFTPEGGKIEVILKDLNDKIIIKVKDDGIGIDKKYHNAIFDRFNQIVDANSEEHGGSGLGLTITKQIIDIHNGEIYVKSEVGKGAEFIIILPVKNVK